MQTWVSLCSRHNFRKWRPTLIVTGDYLHNSSEINKTVGDEVLDTYDESTTLWIPLEDVCSVESPLYIWALQSPHQALDQLDERHLDW